MTTTTINPLVLEKGYMTGHYFFDITGVSLTGAEEIARLRENGTVFDKSIVPVLLSTGPESYDAQHVMIRGPYRGVIVLNKDIMKLNPQKYGKEWQNRRTSNYLAEVSGEYGYRQAPAALQLRIHEALPVAFLREHGLQHVEVSHVPIRNLDERGFGHILLSRRWPQGRTLVTKCDDEWHDPGASVFLMSTSPL